MAKQIKVKRLYVKEAKADKTVQFGPRAAELLHTVAKKDPQFFKEIKTLYYPKYHFTKQRLYDRLHTKYFTNVDLFVDQRQELVGHFTVCRRKNELASVTKEHLRATHPGISEALLNECHEEAKNLLRKEFELEKDSLVDIHVLRYEGMYEQHCNPDLTNTAPEDHDMIRAKGYMAAIKVMGQKEKVLGIHSKTFKVQINNYLQLQQRQQEQTLNFDNLTFHEQVELLRLVEATKINDIVRPVEASEEVAKPKAKEESKTLIEAPIQSATQTDVIGHERAKEVGKQGKTLDQVQHTIRENIRKQLEEAAERREKKK